jgi:hypothetical protein
MNASRVALATLVAGALDIGSVFFYIAMLGGDQARMLAAIASGPFGSDVVGQAWAPALGLAVHFAIMSAMVAFYALIADRYPEPLRRLGPVAAGIGYGLGLYIFMFWVVLPLRWPDVHPNTELWPVARMIFSHVAMVGLPIAFILRPRGAPRDNTMPVAAGSQ